MIKLGIYHRQTGWLLGDGKPGFFARHVLLHEMIHQFLSFTGRDIRHASRDWCAEIMRIGPELGLPPFQAEPSRVTKVRLQDGRRLSKRVTGGDWTMPMIAGFPHLAFDYDTGELRPEFAAADSGGLHRHLPNPIGSASLNVSRVRLLSHVHLEKPLALQAWP